MTTVIPRSYIENYSKSLNMISDTAKSRLVGALEQVDYTRPAAEVRDAVITIMQAACGASTDVTARLAADFYDGLRVLMVGERMGAVADSMRNPDATDGAVRAFIQTIVDGGETDSFIKQCASRLDYENRKAANLCVYENAKTDQLKPKWARIPQGDDTCSYCIIMASRGFVYGDEDMASHTHENCDCRIAPSWESDAEIEGYKENLASYKAVYDAARDLLRDDDKPEELRLRIESAKNKHIADYEAGRTKTKWTELNELTICARWLNPQLH